ncbi:hypothetical protein CALCODRAFT_522579 [Calocera cornea HHB12733]|uniref:Uncharacterized protein n=1 Tax=Calocera cornea HHB12733 TaxID=1353952 RepID=A0A165JFL1_9BASI|nr:hypothetical protein CALCODRAFT_522579 [Calocera cornea HHB12733]
MASLALTIFLLVLLTQLIDWVGKSLLEDWAFALYSRLLISGPARQQRALKRDVFREKQELARTSAQDEFAKWARLRRRVDKGLADLDKLNAQLSSARSAFSLRFKALLFLLTSGAQWALVWYYRAAPVFYLPPGWLGPIAWWLSLPFAPAGSVSCGMWQFACRRVLKLSESLVREIVCTSLPSVPPSVPPSLPPSFLPAFHPPPAHSALPSHPSSLPGPH